MTELADEQIKAVIVAIDPDEQYMPKALMQFARAIIAAMRMVESATCTAEIERLKALQKMETPQLRKIHPLDFPIEVFLADLTTRPANIIRAELAGFASCAGTGGESSPCPSASCASASSAPSWISRALASPG